MGLTKRLTDPPRARGSLSRLSDWRPDCERYSRRVAHLLHRMLCAGVHLVWRLHYITLHCVAPAHRRRRAAATERPISEPFCFVVFFRSIIGPIPATAAVFRQPYSHAVHAAGPSRRVQPLTPRARPLRRAEAALRSALRSALGPRPQTRPRACRVCRPALPPCLPPALRPACS